VLGAALVAVFLWRSATPAKAGTAPTGVLPNLYLLGAVLTCALGYVAGAKATPVLGAERVICWMCAAMLPVALPLTLWLWPAQPVAPSAWAGFAYAGTVSMWAGFFAWYRGLDWGGALRVSQVQLLQPFLAMLAAWPLLGEAPAGQALLFCLGVIATVYAAKRFSTPTPNRPYPESASANPAAASAVAVLADAARPATHQRGARRLAVQIKPMHLGAGQGANHSDGRRHREDLQRGHAAKGAVLCAAKRRTPR
jgi:drug/metabolite transporter (DMT)-like permease